MWTLADVVELGECGHLQLTVTTAEAYLLWFAIVL